MAQTLYWAFSAERRASFSKGTAKSHPCSDWEEAAAASSASELTYTARFINGWEGRKEKTGVRGKRFNPNHRSQHRSTHPPTDGNVHWPPRLPHPLLEPREEGLAHGAGTKERSCRSIDRLVGWLIG